MLNPVVPPCILLIYPVDAGAELLSVLLVRSNIAGAAAHPAVQTMGDQFPLLLSSPLLDSPPLSFLLLLYLGPRTEGRTDGPTTTPRFHCDAPKIERGRESSCAASSGFGIRPTPRFHLALSRSTWLVHL